MEEEEIPLAGGNVNLGVVRVGNTVRRATSAVSPAVHRLLLHLEAKGFAGSPRFLGLDDKGREILSYLPGETGVPRYLWHSDESVIATAELLRDYHDATLDFAMEESMVWGKMENLLGPEVAEKLEIEGHLPHWRREARAFEQNRRRAEANIGTA